MYQLFTASFGHSSCGCLPRRGCLPARRGACALRLAGRGAVSEAEVGGAGSVGCGLPVDLLHVVAGGLHSLAAGQEARLDGEHLRLDVLQRIHPVPPRRDPLHRPQRGRAVGGVDGAGEHRRVEPAPPHRAAQLEGEDAVLQLLDAPATNSTSSALRLE